MKKYKHVGWSIKGPDGRVWMSYLAKTKSECLLCTSNFYRKQGYRPVKLYELVEGKEKK